MKKGLFTGWKDVFAFTFRQAATSKYKKSTVIAGIVLALAGAAISIIMALVEKSIDNYVSPIETVYVVDDSGLQMLALDSFRTGQEETFPDVRFEKTNDSIETLADRLAGQEQGNVILHVEEVTQDGEVSYQATVLIPDGSLATESDGEKLGEALQLAMQQSILLSSDISVEKLAVALSGVNVNTRTAGEEGRSMGEELVQMLLPMALMLFTYLMVLIYGMNIGNVVSVEKSSKLMEMILTLTKPYGLILGKVLALSLSAIVQIVAWLGGFVAGFIAGHYIADTMIYPGYVNYLIDVFKLLKGKEGISAFSGVSLVMGLVTVILGFVLYCALAALVASFASKAEELANVMSYYQIALVAGFFASYMLPLQEKEWINVILRLVPLTAAYKLPGDIVVGNIPLWQGFAYGALLLVFVGVFSILAGMAYKNEIFNKGKSPLAALFKKKEK